MSYVQQFRARHEATYHELDAQRASMPHNFAFVETDSRQLQAIGFFQPSSDDELICWATRGDQLASYVLAMRFLTRGDQHEAVKWLERASAGKDVTSEKIGETFLLEACTTRMRQGDPTCEYGLPEAQFSLARILCSLPDKTSTERGLKLFVQSYRGGYWPADPLFTTESCGKPNE